MIRANKIPMLSLVLVVLFLIFITGCPANETATPAAETATPTATTKVPGPFTEQELQQIVAAAKAATMATDNYKLGIDVTSTVYGDDSSQIGMISMQFQAIFDELENQIMMSGETSSSEAGKDTQTQDIELYVLKDYVYIGATIPDAGKQWIKAPATDEILGTFDVNMMQEEMKIMDSPASVEFIEYATVRGIDCYVVKLIPNAEYLREYAQQQTTGQVEIDWSKIEDISKMYEELSYRIWIAKDSKYVHKIEIKATLALTDDFVTSGMNGLDKMTVDVNGSIEMYDYNTPVSIELPDEAENAIEISPDMM